MRAQSPASAKPFRVVSRSNAVRRGAEEWEDDGERGRPKTGNGVNSNTTQYYYLVRQPRHMRLARLRILTHALLQVRMRSDQLDFNVSPSAGFEGRFRKPAPRPSPR